MKGKSRDIYRREKAKFGHELTSYLLSKVDEFLKTPKEDQYEYLKSFQGKTTNRINKKYRRIWFRDLPDPKYVPEDISDGILVLHRLPHDRKKDFYPLIEINCKLMNKQMDLENEFGLLDDPIVYSDHVINYWLDEYARIFPEKFIRTWINL